jgi:hypothetical protein
MIVFYSYCKAWAYTVRPTATVGRSLGKAPCRKGGSNEMQLGTPPWLLGSLRLSISCGHTKLLC